MKRQLFKTGVTVVVTMLATTTAFASVGQIMTFKGDSNTIQPIEDLKKALVSQTTTLNQAIDALKSKNQTIRNQDKTIRDLKTKQSQNDIYEAFWNAFKSDTYRPFNKPQFPDKGQIYWSSDFGSLVTTNGAQSAVWIGSTWLPITSWGTLSGSTVSVARFIANSPGPIIHDGLDKFQRDGSTGSTGVPVDYNGTRYVTPLSNLHWDDNSQELVATGYYTVYGWGIIKIGVQFHYMVTDNGGHWTN